MKKKLFIFLLIFSVSIFTTLAFAKVSLSGIISSNMVLQRNTKVSILGWADAGEKIMIRTSWLKEPLHVKAASTGDWKIILQTTNSKKPQSIWISCNKQTIALTNILFGEVWLCSGQSNMEIPISGYMGLQVYGAQEAITDAANDNIRLFTISNQASLTLLNKLRVYKGWQSASAASVKDFSDIAYFFSKHLQKVLGVPVGLIHSSWGGSLIEAWMSKESLGAIKHFDLNNVDLKRGNCFPTVLFNAMIHSTDKKDVADRLLYNALHKTYGFKAIDYAGPVYVSMYNKNDGIYLTFKHADKGLYAFNKLDGFELAGADKVFYPAEATIYQRKEVFVKSDKVSNPVPVRYCWRSWTVGTLFDNFLLPVSSFITANWDDAKQSE